MLEKFEISAFKSHMNTKVSLGRVNVFVGANGSGKSSLLEALGVLGAAADGRVDDSRLKERGVRPGVPELYKSSFASKGDQIPTTIDFRASGDDSVDYQVSLTNRIQRGQSAWIYESERLSVPNKLIIERLPTSEDRGDLEYGRAALERANWMHHESHGRFLRALSKYRIFTPSTDIMRGLYPDRDQQSPIGLSGGLLAEAFEELGTFLPEESREALEEQLREMLGWVREVSASAIPGLPVSRSVPATQQKVLKFIDKYMSAGRNTLTSYDASEGALHVIFAAVLCLHPHAPILCAVDNIDQGINPRLARALMGHICEWTKWSGRQVLVTVHNPTSLDGLPIDDDDVRLFTVDRARDGVTSVNRVVVTDRMLELAQNQGWTLSRMWVAGDLGGVPDV
jgi:predicted ATPase